MKTYIIPTTTVSRIEFQASMMIGSETKGNTGIRVSNTTGSTADQRTKERDVWSEGFWE